VGGDPRFLLGTDNQGRDMLSAILYGARVSLMIGGGAVLLAALIGISLGLVAGYVGGRVDAAIMRMGDVILSFPTILLALLVAGLARALIPEAANPRLAPLVLIAAITIHEWVQYARTVRAATMVESAKDYIKAARVIGFSPARIMFRHILPNVMGPVLVLATINLAGAVLTEATLSFLGVGMPPTYPSLGTLIRIGNEFVFSGIWWIALFPALTLVILVLAVNVLGDWLRDRFNPKLRGRG
jgi:peptide/nickel transport system permease protein